MSQPVKTDPKCSPVTAGYEFILHKAGSFGVRISALSAAGLEEFLLLDESVTSAEILHPPFPPICLHFTNGHIILSRPWSYLEIGHRVLHNHSCQAGDTL